MRPHTAILTAGAVVICALLPAALPREARLPLMVRASPLEAHIGPGPQRGAGGCLADPGRWLFVVHEAPEVVPLTGWSPRLYESRDEGATWTQTPARFEQPPFADHVWVHSLARVDGLHHAFGHWHDGTAKTRDYQSAWNLIVWTSQDGLTWRVRDSVLPSGNPRDQVGNLSNPAVVEDGGRFWMFLSECVGGMLWQLRVYDSPLPRDSYRDCGVIVPIGAASWCRYGVWDSRPFRSGSMWWLLTAGRSDPWGTLTAIGTAWAATPAGPWHIGTSPLLKWPGGLGGRMAVFPLKAGGFRVYFDGRTSAQPDAQMGLFTFTLY